METADGRQICGRQYPWGTIEVDNEEHCDSMKLRQMLIRTHMEELKEHTSKVLYENYRSEKLLSMGVTQDHSVFKEVKSVSFSLFIDVGDNMSLTMCFFLSSLQTVRRRRWQKKEHYMKLNSVRWKLR